MVDKLKKSKTILGSYYVINLKRRPDRLELFKKNCPLDNSKINRFEAVDGKLSTSIPDNFKSLSKGEVGCFLSHKLLWEKTLKQKDSDYSIIFEDDAIFTENFQEDFNDIINTDINFNILYFGGRWVKNYKMKTCIKVTDKIVKYDYNKKWNSMDCDRGTFGYIISKKCCKLLLKNFNKILKTKQRFYPVDHFIMNILRLKKIDIYHSYPLICHGEINSSDSDIR